MQHVPICYINAQNACMRVLLCECGKRMVVCYSMSLCSTTKITMFFWYINYIIYITRAQSADGECVECLCASSDAMAVNDVCLCVRCACMRMQNSRDCRLDPV